MLGRARNKIVHVKSVVRILFFLLLLMVMATAAKTTKKKKSKSKARVKTTLKRKKPALIKFAEPKLSKCNLKLSWSGSATHQIMLRTASGEWCSSRRLRHPY